MRPRSCPKGARPNEEVERKDKSLDSFFRVAFLAEELQVCWVHSGPLMVQTGPLDKGVKKGVHSVPPL